MGGNLKTLRTNSNEVVHELEAQRQTICYWRYGLSTVTTLQAELISSTVLQSI